VTRRHAANSAVSDATESRHWERLPVMQRWLLMPGKRIQFGDETLHALNVLAGDRMMDFQELADEAFGDLLKKYGRSTDLKTALRESVKREESERH
jgi:hypothetical protein